jgi:hypothetical protein
VQNPLGKRLKANASIKALALPSGPAGPPLDAQADNPNAQGAIAATKHHSNGCECLTLLPNAN